MVTLLIRGGNVELDSSEAFNKVKHRIQKAKQNRVDYELGNSEDFNGGNAALLQFKTNQGEDTEAGRIFVDVADVFGCMSDEEKDAAGSGDDE